MDDERLTALFRDAASDTDAPPPRFGHDDVLAASRRITARRRSAAIGAAAVIGLAGLGAAIVLPGSGETSTTAAGPAPEAARDAAGSALADEEAGSAGLPSPYATDPGSVPNSSSGSGSGSGSDEGSGGDAGSEAPGEAAPAPSAPAPLGPGSGACADRQDPALRALVEQVLPGTVAAQPAPTTDVCLPGADRYLAIEVTDRGARGVLTVGYLPPGTIVALVPGTLSAATASGGTVLVGSTAEGGGPAPFADRLQDLLDHLAPRL
jgi:hypothetical protein